MNARKLLIDTVIANKGDWGKVYSIFSNKEMDKVPKADDFKGNCITMVDQDYPDVLKDSDRPPFVLFYEGDLSLLKNNNIISVVGTRNPSDEGVYATRTLLSEEDTIIHSGSLGTAALASDTVNHSIVVLPHGLDFDRNLVDSIVSKGGLVLTEFPLGVEKTQDNCGAVCRIIEKLAHKTLVLEAHKYGSSAIRVSYALKYGHDVYVVPMSLSNDKANLNNQLIRDGAIIVLDKEDLHDERKQV